jgi:Swiss Army Knife RNA repair-like protein
LLVDVDGVISLFGFDHADPPAVSPVTVDGTPHWISEGAGARLIRLARTFECVWCTGWEERAEEHLPYLLGLPGGWEHLSFGPIDGDWRRGHWKLEAIDTWAGPTRPLAWVDDTHDDVCRAWAAERGGPTLLVSTDPAVGLTDDHVATLEVWAQTSGGI